MLQLSPETTPDDYATHMGKRLTKLGCSKKYVQETERTIRSHTQRGPVNGNTVVWYRREEALHAATTPDYEDEPADIRSDDDFQI